MSSQRHNGSAESDPGREARPDPRDGYLDTARECILDIGWGRTTLTEIARRAGVSRMTLYRAWPDMEALLADLLTREVADIRRNVGVSHDLKGLASEGRGGAQQAEIIADLMVAVVRAVRNNDLFVRIIELDPQLLLPYLFDRRGRSQQLILDVIGMYITGTNAEAIARSIILMAQGFVLSAYTMTDDEVSVQALDRQLRRAVVAVLAEPGGEDGS